MSDKQSTEKLDETVDLSENPISEILAQGQSSREEIRHSVEKGIDFIQRLLRQEARGREFIYITTKVLVSYPGVTQREIAAELDISQAAVRDWAKRGNVLLNEKAEQGKAQGEADQ